MKSQSSAWINSARIHMHMQRIYAHKYRFQMTPIRNASVRHLTSAKHAYTPYCAVIRVVEYGCWLDFFWFWPQIHRSPISPIAHGLGKRVRKRDRGEQRLYSTFCQFVSISFALFVNQLFWIGAPQCRRIVRCASERASD